MFLNSQIIGNGSPVIILHGLFGSGRNWGTVARCLAEKYQVHCLDLRNHGSSPWAVSMSYPDMVADVMAYLVEKNISPVNIIGHSMGGKVAMLMALKHPQMLKHLIIVDIAPFSYQSHIFENYIKAMQEIRLYDGITRREIDVILAKTIAENDLRNFLMQNLQTDQHGRFQWRINLAAISANLPDILAFPEIQCHYNSHVTFIAGGKSDYIAQEHETAIGSYFPLARIEMIAESGHWPHAERPNVFIEICRKIL